MKKDWLHFSPRLNNRSLRKNEASPYLYYDTCNFFMSFTVLCLTRAHLQLQHCICYVVHAISQYNRILFS